MGAIASIQLQAKSRSCPGCGKPTLLTHLVLFVYHAKASYAGVILTKTITGYKCVLA